MSFEAQVYKLLGVEGGYSDNKNDSGGETNWGIAEKVARENGYEGPMKDMPRDTAVGIYRKVYWVDAGCDYFHSTTSAAWAALAADLFECGVNMGVHTAGAFIQRAINALSVDKITVDGVVGVSASGAAYKIFARRGEEGMKVLRSMFLSLVSYHYIAIVEANPSQSEFIYGWQLNRVVNAP